MAAHGNFVFRGDGTQATPVRSKFAITMVRRIPDSSQLHDARVEPICRKYLELRYRMLPYLYSAVRECARTGMPIMRALWLHFPDDPKAVECGDEFCGARTFWLLRSLRREQRSSGLSSPRRVV